MKRKDIFNKTSLFIKKEALDIKESDHVIYNKSKFNYNKKVYDIGIKRKKILCYHCCHLFDNVSISNPIRKQLNKVYTTGIYCSWNCCFRHAKDTNSLNFLLFKNFYEFVTKKNIRELKQAAPKETLYAFGGILTIEEFRENFETNETFEMSKYPIIHEIEQVVVTSIKKIVDNNFNFKPNLQIGRAHV